MPLRLPSALRRLFSLTLTLLSLAAPLSAEDDIQRLDTGDDGRGWEAVGRIDMAGAGFCTGALIAPDLVLTAAHCLFDAQGDAQIDPARMTFRAGWRNGRAEAYRGVRRAVVHPDFINLHDDRLARIAHDLALLQLDQPIRSNRIVPFDTATALTTGAEVELVSYAQGRSEAPSLQDVCHVLEQRDGVAMIDCAVNFGASGAPVFVAARDGMQIASVVSAKAAVGGMPVALGVDLARPLAELRAAFDTPQTIRKADIGAKFLRP